MIAHMQISRTAAPQNLRMTFKVVIITDLGQRQNQLKIQQIFLKLYRCLLYVVFHNLGSQNAGLVDFKKDLNERSKVFFVRENLKN